MLSQKTHNKRRLIRYDYVRRNPFSQKPQPFNTNSIRIRSKKLHRILRKTITQTTNRSRNRRRPTPQMETPQTKKKTNRMETLPDKNLP